MAKDSLARGAKSATFSAGQAKQNDPIEFHGTVAEEDHYCEGPDVCGCEQSLIDAGLARLATKGTMETAEVIAKDLRHAAAEAAHIARIAACEPLNDRVLLRRVEETSDKLVVEPDAFAQKPNKAEVLSVSFGLDHLIAVGDIVFYGEYNAEDIVIDGEKLLLVNLADIRMRIHK